MNPKSIAETMDGETIGWLKTIAKNKEFKSTLWLVDVKAIYEEYNYNLGYIRTNNKKPRIQY